MVCLFVCGARSGEFLLSMVLVEVGAERFGMGFGRAETPQFVKPRITPPLESMIFPAVRAMLQLVRCCWSW